MECCKVCDRELATVEQGGAWQDGDPIPEGLCFAAFEYGDDFRSDMPAECGLGKDCPAHAVDWRLRALNSEAKIAAVEHELGLIECHCDPYPCLLVARVRRVLERK